MKKMEEPRKRLEDFLDDCNIDSEKPKGWIPYVSDFKKGFRKLPTSKEKENKTDSTEPVAAIKNVDKPAREVHQAVIPGLMPTGQPTLIAAVIEVPTQPGCILRFNERSTCRNIFEVNSHNYLFTSECCMECIKVKHKKMLRAYLIDHGAVPGLRLWWKIWRATR